MLKVCFLGERGNKYKSAYCTQVIFINEVSDLLLGIYPKTQHNEILAFRCITETTNTKFLHS